MENFSWTNWLVLALYILIGWNAISWIFNQNAMVALPFGIAFIIGGIFLFKHFNQS